MQLLLNDIPYSLMDLTIEADKLVDEYLKLGLLGEKHLNDLQHMAIATLNNCHYIASWNFKHFANVTINAKVQGINKMLGFIEVVIYAPIMFLGGIQ